MCRGGGGHVARRVQRVADGFVEVLGEGLNHAGLRLGGNLFGSTFYTLTGLHGLHVSVGVLWLLSLLGASFRHSATRDLSLDVEIAGLYWHFVDLVWIAIFTMVYLLEYVP